MLGSFLLFMDFYRFHRQQFCRILLLRDSGNPCGYMDKYSTEMSS